MAFGLGWLVSGATAEPVAGHVRGVVRVGVLGLLGSARVLLCREYNLEF